MKPAPYLKRIAKADRRTKVFPPDWRYQVAQLGRNSWWVSNFWAMAWLRRNSAELEWLRPAPAQVRDLLPHCLAFCFCG